MVGAARALIAEPNLVKNAFEGNEERSRTCIACNWCLHGMLDDYAQSCTINPTSYREKMWDPDKLVTASKRSKVIIVGAGPGGLEAARTAALRGHKVTLYEERSELGGALRLWANLPGREFFMKSIDWWTREVERLGVTVHTGKRVDAEQILREKPDAVIVATGALYSRQGYSNFRDQPLPGHERAFVCTVEDVLLGKVDPKGNVVVLDGEGYNAGVGVAEVLATRGAKVEYLTSAFSPTSPRVRGTEETRFIMQRLRAAHVTITPTTYVKRIGERELTVFDVFTEEERTISNVDAVVLSTSRESVNELEGMGIIRLLVTFALFAIALIVVLDNLGVNVTGLVAGLGVGGIAIGLAAQGIFADLFAALAIIFDRPFRRGDAITYDQSSGTVEAIGLKSTRVRGAAGEERIIANRKLLDFEILNTTRRAHNRFKFEFFLGYATAPDVVRRVPDMLREAVESEGHTLVHGGLNGFADNGLGYDVEFESVGVDFKPDARDREN